MSNSAREESKRVLRIVSDGRERGGLLLRDTMIE